MPGKDKMKLFCKYQDTIGAVAVYVKESCPNKMSLKGKFVVTKTKCQGCEFFEPFHGKSKNR